MNFLNVDYNVDNHNMNNCIEESLNKKFEKHCSN